jgi:release factor glutamine methyltransferase
MPAERVELLRVWHERAIAEGRRDEPITVVHLGHTFAVPPEVYPPHPLGLAELVRAEVRSGERVLDLGTGSGVNAVVAAAAGADVLAVDVNPVAVGCARANAAANGVAGRVDVRESDVFDAVDGRFDLVVFDPPFRWFAPRDLWERGTADENYEALTRFFAEVGERLTPAGRILLGFGTTGDIDYLHELIERAALAVEELRRVEGERDGFPVAYVAYRLAPADQPPSGQPASAVIASPTRTSSSSAARSLTGRAVRSRSSTAASSAGDPLATVACGTTSSYRPANGG